MFDPTNLPAPSRRTLLRGVAAGIATAPLLRWKPARAAVSGNVVIGTNGWLYPAWDDMRSANPALWTQVTSTIAMLIGRLKQHGIATVVSLTPNKGRVYGEFLPPDFLPSPDVARRYAAGIQMLGAAGIAVPDLATLFAATRANPPPAPASDPSPDFVPVGTDLYFKADTHWTPNATLPAAKAIADRIAALNLLPASPKPGTTLGAPQEQVQEKNDLAELLTASQQASYPIESYFAPAVVAAEGDDALIAVDAADVTVIGNSYMQPKYAFADTLSNLLNRPVSLDWKIDRYGPYATLVDYLKSDSFKQQRPKLIVWNFREQHLEYLPDDTGAWGPSAMPTASVTAAIDQMAGG